MTTSEYILIQEIVCFFRPRLKYMCECVCVCVGVCVCVSVCVCIYVCMYVFMYVCMYACMYVCMYVCMYACMYRVKIFEFFPTTFLTQRTCFTQIYIDPNQKIAKKFFNPIFQKVLIPYRAKISKFEKIFIQLFSVRKQVSNIFTLIKGEKPQKNFSTPFFKNFYKFGSPIG